MKKIVSIGILLFVIIAFSGVVSATDLKVPTKYKTHTYTNNYYKSGSSYYNGEYIWEPKKSNYNYNSFSVPVIHEKYSGSQTKIQFWTYNNNNKYHYADVRSSQLTVNYKIKTSTKTYYASKTVKYTKIPNGGMDKTLILKGPVGSQVLIYYMKWTQVHRDWYTQKSINKQTSINSWQISGSYYQNNYIKITKGKTYVNGYVSSINPITGKVQKGAVYAYRVKITPLNKHVKIKKITIRSIGWPSGKFYYNTYYTSNFFVAPGKYKGFDRFTIYYTIS